MTAPSRLCVFGYLTAAAILPAAAADLASPPPPAAYAAPVQPLSIVSEIRIGGAVQDPGSAEGKLPGFSKANVNGEILFAKPRISDDPFWQAFVQRPTVGGSWRVRVALARTAFWLDELGRVAPNAIEPADPGLTDVADLLAEMPSDFGRLTYVRIPGDLRAAPPRWRGAPHRLGADPAQWW